MKGTWIDIGRPRDLIKANVFVAGKATKKVKGSRLKGKIYLGKNVRIGKNCVLEDVAIYDGAVIEDNVRIKNSVVYDNSSVGGGSKIEDSILSFGSVLGEGVIISDSVIGGGLLLRKGGKIEGTVVSLGEDKPGDY
jgi:NDP-sugar pyrophosphorylase family protein